MAIDTNARMLAQQSNAMAIEALQGAQTSARVFPAILTSYDTEAHTGEVTVNGGSYDMLKGIVESGGLVYINLMIYVSDSGAIDPEGTLDSILLFTSAYTSGTIEWNHESGDNTLVITGLSDGWTLAGTIE